MNWGRHILLFLVRLYRWIVSPLLGALFGPAGGCRFTPTCSAYAADAVRVHGAVTGSWLALRRVGRCHPWGGCGHDPVPPRAEPVGSPARLSSGLAATAGKSSR